MPEYRTETDSMGPIRVPADRYYGAQTARSLTHFAVGADTMPRPVLRAFGTLKKAAALVNKGLGLLAADKCNLIAKAGYPVVLSQHIIEHVVPPMTFGKMWDRQVRWAKGTRYSRPKGHFGTGLVFAVPFGLIGLAAAWALGHPLLGAWLLAAAVLNRMVESLVIGWGIVRDPIALRSPWLYPVRDLLGFLVWCASYVSRKAVWRDHRFELVEGGKIVIRQTTPVN